MDRAAFEAERERIRRKNAEMSASIDLVSSLFLADERTPEESKIELRILMELKDLDFQMRKMADYAIPEPRKERMKQLHPLREEVLEYLQLVHIGLQEFIRTHPVPEETK